MKAYVVGGAVRDRLLGSAVNDRDWVVVGASPEDMLAAGYTPVGRDFPVFLHPQTHEEYALARTERKSGRGYKGFTIYAAPDVTLEDDLENEFTLQSFNTREDRMAEILNNRDMLLGLGDGGAHLDMLCDSGYPSYVLGTWVRERKVLTLEEAVRRMTSMVQTSCFPEFPGTRSFMRSH